MTLIHKIGRERSEQMLVDYGKDGAFLVRESESAPNTYSLSVLHRDNVKHYRIKQASGREFYIDTEPGVERKLYASIDELVERYQSKDKKSGLVCSLTELIRPYSDDPDEETEEETYEYVGNVVHDNFGYIAEVLKLRMGDMDLSGVDGEFLSALNSYVSSDCLEDAQMINGGTEEPVNLHKLLVQSAATLEKHLDDFRKKIALFQHIFASNETEFYPPSRKGSRNVNSVHFNTIQNKLSSSFESLKALDNQAVACLQKLLVCPPLVESPPVDRGQFQRTPAGQPVVQESWTLDRIGPATIARTAQFELLQPGRSATVLDGLATKISANPGEHVFTVERLAKKVRQEMKISVNVSLGKMTIVCRPAEPEVIDCTLVKKMVPRLSGALMLHLDGQSKAHCYYFKSQEERNNFRQLVHQAISQNLLDDLSLFVGTWNMGDEGSPWKLDDWFLCQGQGQQLPRNMMPADLYVIGTQESVTSERDWLKRIQDFFQKNYPETSWKLVAVESLWQIRLCVFAKFKYHSKITDVQTAKHATGIADVLGNKGGVAVAFSFQSTLFCFICAHLTSGHEKNDRRNSNYRDILKGLKLGAKSPYCDLTNKFHHVFVLGDLNYRLVEVEPQAIVNKAESKAFPFLLQHDQLNRSMKAGQVLVEFKESEITFPPTYRFQKNSKDNMYGWQKVKRTGIRINAPSYTDRILYKSCLFVNSASYGCVPNINVSDHKPVFSYFNVALVSECKGESNEGQTEVRFKGLGADVAMNTKELISLEIHSTCLPTAHTVGPNREFRFFKEGLCSPKWPELITVKPIQGNLDWLQDQHFLFCIKSEVIEHCGSAVVTLQDATEKLNKFVKFKTRLIKDGSAAGWFEGSVCIQSKAAPPITRKSYHVLYTKEHGQYEDVPEFHTEPPDAKDEHPAPTGVNNTIPTHEDGSFDDFTYKDPEPEEIYSETGQVYNDPDQIYNDPDQIYNDPDQIYNDPNRTYISDSDPDDIYSEPTDEVYKDPMCHPDKSSARSVLENPEQRRGLIRPVATAAKKSDQGYYNVTPSLPPTLRGATRRRPDIDIRDILSVVEDNPLYESDVLATPPRPPPPKSHLPVPGDGYIRLRSPDTVCAWLSSIGLPQQYAEKFHEKQWDPVTSNEKLTAAFLDEIGIFDVSHREKILKSAESFNKNA